MPPKKGGVGVRLKKQSQSQVHQQQQQQQPSNSQISLHVGRSSLAAKSSQHSSCIAPLILEGVKLNKLQLNDIFKQHLTDVKISDIQLGRTGIFTLYAVDVKSFNRLLNDLTLILNNNGQPTAKVYVPRSIQRIKDTEKVAFVKRVDLEIPDDRITEALKNVGLDVTNVTRLTTKDGKTPTRTVKISFSDVQNRNTFVHTGLQVDCMHFTAEPASQNNKPVQCYICLKYNHVAKYCKTKQQVCTRCGDNHRMDQCTVASDAVKCYNCKGNHLATSKDCSHYIEQEKRMLNLINQYTASSKSTTSTLATQQLNEFPPLPNSLQRQQEQMHQGLIDEIINVLSSKMEKIIEETTTRLFLKLQQKIKNIEEYFGNVDNSLDDALTVSDSDSNEEDQVTKHIKNKQKQRAAEAAKQSISSNNTLSQPTTTTSNQTTTSKPSRKKKETTQATKRALSPNSSLDASTLDNKDLKTSNNDD